MRLYLGCEAISYKHYAPVAVCWRRTLPTRLYYGRERPEALACATSEAASRLASRHFIKFVSATINASSGVKHASILRTKTEVLVTTAAQK